MFQKRTNGNVSSDFSYLSKSEVLEGYVSGCNIGLSFMVLGW